MSAKKILLLITALLLLGAGTAVFLHYRGHGGSAAAAQKEIYYCPMHPDYTSDRPGDCPICGMHLVKKEAAAAPAGEKKIKFYRNPMNPAITSKLFMKDGMGMAYIPVYEETGAITVEGRSAVSIGSEKKQLIGVKTGLAKYRGLVYTIRASGRVAYDPELYQAISEYKEALSAREKVKDSSWPDVVQRADALAAASRLRLRQLGLTPEQQDALAGGAAATNLLLPENKAWIYAQLYEYEIGLVQPGQQADIISAAYPGRTFKAEIKGVDPLVSSETRTLRIKAEAENPDKMLKPEMYVELLIKADLGTKLSVLNDAILNTGTRTLVFVEKGEGRFEPRVIRVGRATDDYTEVLSGLKEGEKVVTSANFLVDSESRLKSALTQ